MSVCSVKLCKNRTKKSNSNASVRYFTFLKNEEINQKWIETCGYEINHFNLKDARACSDHFEEADYEISLQQQLMGYSDNNKKLKKNAIPHINLFWKEDCQSAANSTAGTTDGKSQSLVKQTFNDIPVDTGEFYSPPKKTKRTSDFDNCNIEIEKLRSELQEIKNRYEKSKNQCKYWQNKNKEMVKQHAEELEALKNKYENALKQVFTPGQIKKLFNPTKKIRWNSEDISAAISLKSISSRGYRYLRNTVKLPLPAVSTLRRWISQLNFSPGILNNVLKIMEVAANSYHPTQKIVVLSFDEIYLSPIAAIDRKMEQKIGPHERCQVVMARGLFKSWKQPVYYDFDQSMTSEILLNIIKQLYESGFTVVATVCDLGPSNRKAFNDLGCPLNDPESCFFSHPCDESMRVYVFFYVPHLIKLLRNHFLDSGFFIDGSLIDKSIFEKLLLINDTELNLIHKVTQAHLDVTQSERQKVKPAVQLFSDRSAKAILFCYEKGWLKDPVSPLASSCIKIINDWFDLFNIKLKFEKNKTDAYGLDLDRQDAILYDMSEFIKDLRIGNHKNLIDCQKGILRNNVSLKSLFTYLKNTYSTENFKIEYLLTFRLNQNIIENLFSYLRAMEAAHDYPSALDIKNRLRLYILGKYSTNLFSLGTNTEAVAIEEKFIQVDDEIMTRIFFDGTEKNNDASEVEVESEQTEFDTNMEEFNDSTIQDSSSDLNISDDLYQEHPLRLSLEDNIENQLLNLLSEDVNNCLNNSADEHHDNVDDDDENDENVDNLNLQTQNKDVGTDFESLQYIRQQINEEGLKYVAGYIAHRFRYKCPYLGNKTGPFIVGTPCPDWVTFLSRGGLLLPSEELFTIANIHEECFNSFHGLTDLSAEPFIFQKVAKLVRLKLTDELNNYIPEVVLKCLV